MQVGQFTLTPELREIALDALKAFLQAPPGIDGRTPVEADIDLDHRRVELIENTLKPLVVRYLESSLLLPDFKRQVDGINKQNRNIWGFTGIKGQMFFNMLTKTVENLSECDAQLRAALGRPADEESAAAQLRNFKTYVGMVGEQFVNGGGDSRSRPKESSIPYFVSYFWQLQRRELWPVYYTSTVQAAEDMNLWRETGDIGDDYLTYKHLHETLIMIFSDFAGRPFSIYDVEHVFWLKSRRLLSGISSAESAVISETPAAAVPENEARPLAQPMLDLLPEGYVPPIVAVIPKLALNDPEFPEAARRSGTTVERALEKSINAAFTVLGYETQLLGQGMGRVPDGQAIAIDESYAVIWDAKARSDVYRMGTDDRIIRQYIDGQSRSLKRRRSVRNIYYLIISSSFSDEFDDLIRTLKMETDVNEVCLIEAEALVAIVDQKLRSPLTISLGPDGVQRLFSSSGIVTVSDVLENLT